MKYYYLLFIDAVSALKNNSDYSQGGAKFWALVYISVAMSFNLLILTHIVYLLTSFRIEVQMNGIGEGRLHSLINYLVLYLTPPLTINFLLIFIRHKWEKITHNYSSQDDVIVWFNSFMPESILTKLKRKSVDVNGMFFMTYGALSMIAVFLYGVTYGILRSIFNW
jgi:hypothetical protein